MIDEVFILARNGVPLVTWSANDKHQIDPGLVGGFLSAISMFVGQARGEEVKTIGLDPSLILFEDHDDVFFAVVVRDTYAKDLGEYLLRTLSERFLQEYGEQIHTFNGDVEKYRKFSDKIVSIVKECGVDAATRWLNKRVKTETGGVAILDNQKRGIIFRKGAAVENLDPVIYLVPAFTRAARLFSGTQEGGSLVRYTSFSMEPQQIIIEHRGLTSVVILNETGRDWQHWLQTNSNLAPDGRIQPHHLGERFTIAQLLSAAKNLSSMPLLFGFQNTGNGWVYKEGTCQECVSCYGLTELFRLWRLAREISDWMVNSELWVSVLETERLVLTFFNFGTSVLIGMNKAGGLSLESADVSLETLLLALQKGKHM